MKEKTLLREILEEIKIITLVNYRFEVDSYYDWNGTTSFNGYKRMIHGIWNNGDNGSGTNLVEMFPEISANLYDILISKYCEYDEIKVNLEADNEID